MESIEYKCKVCNKQYKTYQTLWKHNKKFHDLNTINNNHSTIINQPNIIINQSKNECNYCKKIFSHYNNKWRHEKKCKIKHDELAKIKEETRQTELLLALKKEESKILQLKLKLEKSNKVDNITLKKLNRMLIERNTRIKNINSNNTINNNQQIINNFQLIGFGKEEVMETLTKHEKKLIMNARYNSLDKLIEIIHCGKYSQFKNIIVTNMKDNYIYKYDDKVGHFVLSTKTDVLNSLIDYRLDDLETIYHDLLENNKLDENTILIIFKENN
jgi:hypothetical protein